MRSGKTWWILLLVVLAVTHLAPSRVLSQEQPARPKVDLGSFVKEVMILKLEGDQRQLAMWFPFEFFVQAGMAEGGKSRSEVEKEIGFLKPYHVIMVQTGWDREDGTTVYSDEKEVRGRATLRLDQGKELKPLDRTPPLVSATVEAMKKMIASEGDEGSANMHVLMFPATTPDQKTVIDMSRKGKLTLFLKPAGRFKQTEVVWHTPFDATTPVPPCPKCKESVSPKWSYCPWCGQKLEKK
jgi:hypothetical protein